MKIVMTKAKGALRPGDRASEDDFARIPEGAEVFVEIRRPRSLKHHKKFMALVGLIFQHQSKYQTRDQLLTAIKLRTGHYDTYIVNDKPVVVPKSLAFDSLDQTAFEDFYDRTLDIVVTEIIPGLRKADLKRELLGFADRPPANGGERRPARQIDDDMSRT